MTAWREFEDLVERLQRAFNPDAVVTRNDKFRGRDSKSVRQIDISIRYKLGMHDILMIVDCKKRTRKTDVKGIEEFAGLKNDVGAHVGLLVNEKGFTKGAINTAARHHVTLLQFVDTKKHGWQKKIFVPVICELWLVTPKLLRFEWPDGRVREFIDDKEVRLTVTDTGQNFVIVDNLVKALSKQPNLEPDSGVYKLDAAVESGQQIAVNVSFECERRFYGADVALNCEGLFDATTKVLHADAFASGNFSLQTIVTTWQSIKKPTDFQSCLRVRWFTPWPPEILKEGLRFAQKPRHLRLRCHEPVSIPGNLDARIIVKKPA